MFNKICYKLPIWSGTIASRFCEEIWTQNPAELLLIRTKAIICEQFLVFYAQIFHKIRAQLIFLALKECDANEREKIIIATCFHDIGIWIENTVDYIPPSIPPAMAYLKERNLEKWSAEIKLMISEHHKIRSFNDKSLPLVEIFRQDDLVDFSFGLSNLDYLKAIFK